jgi:putative ABC transport system permease protein
MLKKLTYNFEIALGAILQNKLRSLLTSLGIVFGVASVIAMLAIGRGAQQEILEQMKLLGADNIIITPIVEQEEGEIEEDEDAQGKSESRRFTPGLNMQDVEALEQLPFIKTVSPEIEMETLVIGSARKRSARLVGVRGSYFPTNNFQLAQGNLFSPYQLEHGDPVCVIGHDIKTRFFPTEDPLGKQIKCGHLWLRIIGVLKPRNVSQSFQDKLGIRNYDRDVYTPISSMLLRYRDRARLTTQDIQKASRQGMVFMFGGNSEQSQSKDSKNYHQLDRIVVQLADNAYSRNLSEIIQRMLMRRHNEVIDFEITVPELLLQQEQRTRNLLNLVLGAIASISLLVGGIGIMNIMLASVLERIKEIGLRLSIGATQKDIILQFMSESIAISVSGGMLGIFLGVTFCYLIEIFANIPTLISTWSVVLSFVVAVSVGLVFGIYPAQKAAKQDPVVSLRYE